MCSIRSSWRAVLRWFFSRSHPEHGPWLFYGSNKETTWPSSRCLAIAHCPESWRFLAGRDNITAARTLDGLPALFPETAPGFEPPADIPFDVVANAFYFLSSWSERRESEIGHMRRLHTNSVYARFDLPQDIVDLYLARIIDLLDAICDRLGIERWTGIEWPKHATHAVVLSHDIDFIPSGIFDVAKQGAKTVLRHLLRQRDPADAIRAAAGLVRALVQGRDPYGCIPEIIERERKLGVRASFQVAVGHRHPDDVNYRIEDERTREYLRSDSSTQALTFVCMAVTARPSAGTGTSAKSNYLRGSYLAHWAHGSTSCLSTTMFCFLRKKRAAFNTTCPWAFRTGLAPGQGSRTPTFRTALSRTDLTTL